MKTVKLLTAVICGYILLTACSTISPSTEISGGSRTQENQISIPEEHTETPTEPPPPTHQSILSISTPTHTPTLPTTPTPPPSNELVSQPTPSAADTTSRAVIIDHTSIELFEQIPENYLTAARELTMLFSDRSVGQNINIALDCLTASSWESSRAACRNDYTDANWNWKTFRQADRTSGSVPARILFDPDPIRYNRDNWTFEYKQGTWSDLTKDFIEVLAPQYIDSKNVLSYQLTYLHVADGEDIVDTGKGYFSDSPERYDIYDLEAFIRKHPDHTFIFWTTSLARSIGTETSQKFNDQMRQYALRNGKILFDVADIESHTDQGVPCYDNRDGIEYCSQTGKCENYPDDNKNLPAICQDYTTETDGGHLGSVSAGQIRLVKALWVLMARIAGWDGISVASP